MVEAIVRPQLFLVIFLVLSWQSIILHFRYNEGRNLIGLLYFNRISDEVSYDLNLKDLRELHEERIGQNLFLRRLWNWERREHEEGTATRGWAKRRLFGNRTQPQSVNSPLQEYSAVGDRIFSLEGISLRKICRLKLTHRREAESPIEGESEKEEYRLVGRRRTFVQTPGNFHVSRKQWFCSFYHARCGRGFGLAWPRFTTSGERY